MDQIQRRRELQTLRLSEVRGLSADEWQRIRLQMTQTNALPKLADHMRKHGADFAEFGIATAKQLEALFLQHIRRTDLAHFTYISTQRGTQYRLWALIGMDNGVVALYNESKQRHWSFMRPASLEEYLNGNRGLWVQVGYNLGKVKARRWQPR